MSVEAPYLHDIGRLAEKLTTEFAPLSYGKFVLDANKIESAVMRLMVMKEGWTWLPGEIRQELVPIDWRAVTGTWDRKAGRHVGIDSRQLWETIVQRLPEMRRKVEEPLKGQTE